MSYGMKYGHPDANFVFDISYVNNPGRLKENEGKKDKNAFVKEYVLSDPRAQEFLKNTSEYLRNVAKQVGIVAAFGCTGGRHRSVTITNELARMLSDEFEVVVVHRDRDKITQTL